MIACTFTSVNFYQYIYPVRSDTSHTPDPALDMNPQASLRYCRYTAYKYPDTLLVTRTTYIATGYVTCFCALMC